MEMNTDLPLDGGREWFVVKETKATVRGPKQTMKEGMDGNEARR